MVAVQPQHMPARVYFVPLFLARASPWRDERTEVCWTEAYQLLQNIAAELFAYVKYCVVGVPLLSLISKR